MNALVQEVTRLSFTALVMIAAMYVYVRRRRLSLLCLSLGCMAHLCLDEMWLHRRTLLWPLYGWSFEKIDISNWLEAVFTSLRTKPSACIPEMMGGLLLGAFFFNSVRRGRLCGFRRTGEAH